jgi:hypothetical protein
MPKFSYNSYLAGHISDFVDCNIDRLYHSLRGLRRNYFGTHHAPSDAY